MMVGEHIGLIAAEFRVDLEMYIGFTYEELARFYYLQRAFLCVLDVNEKLKFVVVLTVKALEEDVPVADNLKALRLILLNAFRRQKLAEPAGFEVCHARSLFSRLGEKPDLCLGEVDAQLFRRLGNIGYALAQEDDLLPVLNLKAHF